MDYSLYSRTHMDNKRAIVAVIAILIGAIAGYLFGVQSGEKAAAEEREKTEKLQKSLDVFVPPLPDVVNVIGGKITAISGDAFTVGIPSLTDRYPKPGQPMTTETKTIRIADDAKITSLSFDPKTFKNGLPQQTAISASDLKAGDMVSVTVKENARTEQNLTATEINRTSGI